MLRCLQESGPEHVHCCCVLQQLVLFQERKPYATPQARVRHVRTNTVSDQVVAELISRTGESCLDTSLDKHASLELKLVKCV
jgi:hypothetical protein